MQVSAETRDKSFAPRIEPAAAAKLDSASVVGAKDED